MNAFGMSMGHDQFRVLLHWSDGASAEVFGRTSRDIPAETDERLKALARGDLSPKERNFLFEELADRPELLRRLAQHLQAQISREDQ